MSLSQIFHSRFLRKSSRFIKIAFCLLLCLVIVFTSSYIVPAHATVGTIVVGGAVLVAAALGALGIGCSAVLPTTQYNEACQHIWDGLSSNVQGAIQSVEEAKDSSRLFFHYSYDALKSIFNGAMTEFPQSELVRGQVGYTINDSSLTSLFPQFSGSSPELYDDLSRITYLKCVDASILSSYPANSLSLPITAYGHTLSYASSKWYFDGSALDAYTHPAFDFTSTMYFIQYRVSASESYRISLVQLFSDGTILSEKHSNVFPFVKDSTSSLYTGPDVFNPVLKQLYAEGHSVMTNGINDVLARLKERVGDATGVEVDVGSKVGDRTKVQDEDKTETQADRVLRDITTTADKTANDTKNQTDNRDTTTPKTSSIPDLTLPQTLMTKFPFCIPWDLANAVKSLSATPQAPVYHVVTNWPVIGNYTFTIDFSKFDLIARIVRWMLSLLFLIGLIVLTPNLIRH